jgi:2-keto-4-pentenoate hydratase/2-oxohepta-3-ene-1,7-dioic acid hydratase in catechol pathway
LRIYTISACKQLMPLVHLSKCITYVCQVYKDVVSAINQMQSSPPHYFVSFSNSLDGKQDSSAPVEKDSSAPRHEFT